MCTSRSGFRRVAQVKEGPASHDDARYRERSLMSTICSHLPSLAARLRSQGFELGEPGVLPHSHAAGQSNVVNVVCSARPSPPRKHVCVCVCVVQEGIDSTMVQLLSHEQLKELGIYRVSPAGRL
jgi:hypothetical protein